MSDVGQLTKNWAESCNLEHEYFEELNSTNTYAKTLKLDAPKIIVTSFQPGGRGRNNNVWVSPKAGTGLLSTWCFTTQSAPQPIISPLIGVAVYRTLSYFFGNKFSIKPPNDIYMDDKKLGGILIESASSGNEHSIMIGVGLNVLAAPDLDEATCLFSTNEELKQKTWDEFLSYLLVELTQAIDFGANKNLTPQKQNELLEALNRFPKLNTPYVKVHPSGSLENKNETIDWHSL